MVVVVKGEMAWPKEDCGFGRERCGITAGRLRRGKKNQG